MMNPCVTGGPTQRLARWLIQKIGWKVVNITPPTQLSKAVVVVAPHTSNWDFVYGMLFKLAHPALHIRFAIKKEVMFFPLSCLMRDLGAIPIDRSKNPVSGRASMVDCMANLILQQPQLLLAIAPEGTRAYAKRWKSGFYRLAQAAEVPIILGYINYAKKEMGLGPLFYPTGNWKQDLEEICNFYRSIPGKYPDQGVR